MKRLVRTGFAIAAAAAIVSAATPAVAETDAPQPKAGICVSVLYQFKNRGGGTFCTVRDANFANNKYANSTKGADNSISSVLFKTGKKCTLTLYQYKNYKGRSSTFQGTGDYRLIKDLSQYNIGDNTTSSMKMVCP